MSTQNRELARLITYYILDTPFFTTMPINAETKYTLDDGIEQICKRVEELIDCACSDIIAKLAKYKEFCD